MANDDSRALFDAKVQEHGFDFLDDYLDSILAQAKQPQSVAFLRSPRYLAHDRLKDRFSNSLRPPAGEGTHERKANLLFLLQVDSGLC